jgi:hypothetical protein
MKKPVRAIDMRRTAMVLDFAVGGFSLGSRFSWKSRLYLSSPFCVVWIDDATPKNGALVVVGWTDVRLSGVVAGMSALGMAVASVVVRLPHLAFYRQHISILIFMIKFSPGYPRKDLINIAQSQKSVFHDEPGFRNMQVKLYSPSNNVIFPRLSKPAF